MDLKLEFIEATNIPDAWFQCVYNLFEKGFRYKIEHGSYVGQDRLEFDWITIHIKYPYSEPWDTMLPEVPSHLGIPNPVENGYIEQYLPYIMTGHKEETEDYTYGQRLYAFHASNTVDVQVGTIGNNPLVQRQVQSYIGDQVSHFIEVLKETPKTNQAILQVGQPSDCLLKDPPCLRHIDMRVKDERLVFYPYFRSWDLWGGFPANLAAIACLQNDMATQIGVEVGPLIASSKGLHLYDYVLELAKLRTGKKEK